jgi:hypothetical protein
VYNDYGQLAKEYQSHDPEQTVDPAATPYMEFRGHTP